MKTQISSILHQSIWNHLFSWKYNTPVSAHPPHICSEDYTRDDSCETKARCLQVWGQSSCTLTLYVETVEAERENRRSFSCRLTTIRRLPWDCTAHLHISTPPLRSPAEDSATKVSSISVSSKPSQELLENKQNSNTSAKKSIMTKYSDKVKHRTTTTHAKWKLNSNKYKVKHRPRHWKIEINLQTESQVLFTLEKKRRITSVWQKV